MLSNLRTKLAAKYLAYRKATEGYCEKHQAFESRFLGCEPCFYEQVAKQRDIDNAAREARLQHKAEVYAKAMADELIKRGEL